MEVKLGLWEKEDDFAEFFQSLPKANLPDFPTPMAEYKGFWSSAFHLKGILSFQNHFQARPSDIILASSPKSGTTWLKALTFTILNRDKFPISESPLLSSNPHQLVRFLETDIYNSGGFHDDTDIISMPGPRLLATHAPYHLLPATILEAGSKVIYVGRNPLDTFTSALHFYSQIGALVSQPDPNQTNALFGSFCDGIFPCGPFWDHNLGYWEASLRDATKVLFLKYEDMLEDANASVVKISEFLGCAFTAEEMSAGLVEEITNLCELQNLKNLECNKKGDFQNTSGKKIRNSMFFRKGEVGDWVNSLHSSSAERIGQVMEDKFGKSGLTFDIK